MTISIILAHDAEYGIGKNDYIPWRCVEDIRFFKKVTTGCNLIVGRTTWNGLGDPVRRSFLKDRKMIIISTNPDTVSIPRENHNNFKIVDSYDKAMEIATTRDLDTFIIGGAFVYSQAIVDKRVCSCYISSMTGTYDCDTHVSFIRHHLQNDFQIVRRMNLDDEGKCLFSMYTRRHEEKNYQEILNDIMTNGSYFEDRTGIGIRSLFGKQLRFDCSENFPLLTTKKMFLRGIAEELFWFINGSTNSIELEEKNVNIWKGNTSRDFLDKNGFTEREIGDIGPGYGHQWRHWNAKYTNCQASYEGLGIDQLKNCIQSILHEKETKIHDRRNLMIAWNPEQVPEMSLPPCHVLVQFYLNGNDLSLHMYQRSADMFLGVPFNISSYALLLKMVAIHTGCKPKDLVMSFGDCHVYSNHFEQVNMQLSRQPYEFPKLKINQTDMFKTCWEDLEIIDYKHHDPIKAEMAA